MNSDAPQKDLPLLGIGTLVVAMAFLALMDATGKYLTGTYPVTQILWARYAVFLLLAVASAGKKGIGNAFKSRQKRLQTGRSLVLVCEVLVFLVSFKYLDLVTVHAIAAATPLIATALAIPLLREKVGFQRWTAVLIGCAGVMIIIRPGTGIFGPMIYLPLLGATLWALYQILVRRLTTDGAATTSLYTATTGFLVFSLTLPFEWQSPDLQGWLLLALTGIFGGFGHMLLIRSLQLAPSSVLQPFNYSLMVWGAILGFIIFHNVPDRWTIVGAFIIIASGLFALYRQQRRQSDV